MRPCCVKNAGIAALDFSRLLTNFFSVSFSGFFFVVPTPKSRMTTFDGVAQFMHSEASEKGGDMLAADDSFELLSAASDGDDVATSSYRWGNDMTHLAQVDLSPDRTLSLMSMTFKEGDPQHDFSLLVRNPAIHKTTLFLFNDHYFGWRNIPLYLDGGGSACIRSFAYPYGYQQDVFVAGIPTGWCTQSGGFDVLGDKEKMVIDFAFFNIQHILRAHTCIDTIVFSGDPSDKASIGQGIFTVAEDVIKYISSKLVDDLINFHLNDCMLPSMEKIERMCVKQLDPVAVLMMENGVFSNQIKKLLKRTRQMGPAYNDFSNAMCRLLEGHKIQCARRNVPISKWKAKKSEASMNVTARSSSGL